ncbi:MAG: Cgl0159 family (beta/alpha)8-fold protein [bacterium]
MAKYSLGNYKFVTEEFLPEKVFHKITEVRVDGAKRIVEAEAKERAKRRKLTKDGKLTILAADHPARMVTRVGDNPIAMADRLEYLGRVLRVITNPEFDGVMGTTDIIEDLFIVNYLLKKAGGESFLDGKVILGCTNRGGLSGVSFEMDDTMTSFTPESIKKLRLDGAKMMFRLDPDSPDSGKTIKYCADLITQLNDLGIPSFVEALPLKKDGGKYSTLKVASELVKVVGVASALGSSSTNIWLKIPYCEDYNKVARATTCPILMLGGESLGDPTGIINEFYKGMQVGGSVRGALVGRNITFPGNDDPCAVAVAVNNIVHNGYDVDRAIDCLMETRGKNMDILRKIG